MAEIDRYRSEDRRQVEALYRRVFGPDAAEANRLRWDWQDRCNPNVPAEGPLIWIAREGTTVIGQDATMPVKLSVGGRDIDASWGMDVMVAPERQRQGLGDVLFRTWDRETGAALGLGLSDSSHRLFQKMHVVDLGPVPCLVKPLSRRALRRPGWPVPVNRLVSYVTLPGCASCRDRGRSRGKSRSSVISTRDSRGCGNVSPRTSSSPSAVMRRTLMEGRPGAARPLLDCRPDAGRRADWLRRASPPWSRRGVSRCSSTF